jgi:hypothetical protein
MVPELRALVQDQELLVASRLQVAQRRQQLVLSAGETALG